MSLKDRSNEIHIFYNMGCKLYCSSAAKSNLEKLNKIQNSCMRLILGAWRTTPIVSLEVETHIPPLEIHRGYLIVKDYMKLHFKPLYKRLPKLYNMVKKDHLENAHVNSYFKREKI